MELFTIPLTDPGSEDKFIIYRPLAGLAFIGNRAMADFVQQLVKVEPGTPPPATQTGAILQSIGFFQLDPQNSEEITPWLTTAVLLLTNRCHLRCVYCYADAGTDAPLELEVELGKIAIDFVCTQVQQQGLSQFEVSFHGGGEPTFAWETLKSLTQYTRSKTVPAKISLTTNAIWSPRQRDWILANIDNLSISMDGSPQTQDQQRPLVSGKQSSGIVLKNIAAVDRAGVSYGIRMTASSPWERLLGDVQFILEETGCKFIQVEPAFNIKRGEHALPDEKDCRQFAQAFLEAYDIARSYKRKLVYSGGRPAVASSTFCLAPYKAFVLAPGGKIVSCYEVASQSHPLYSLSSFGHIENQVVMIDEENRARLHSLFAERRATCRDCFCYWSCGGDCYARVFINGQDGHLIKSPRCDLNREVTKQLLANLIEENNGVWIRHSQDQYPAGGLG
jgi:uncharacterized protein